MRVVAIPVKQETGCKECGRLPLRRRGLCRRCYENPDIREKHYPHDNAVRDFSGPAKPTALTKLLPGSRQKVYLLEDRALAGEELFQDGEPGVIASRFAQFLEGLNNETDN